MPNRVEQMAEKALRASDGDKLLAQKELLKAVLANDELLREMVAPFLKGITAQAIERVAGGNIPLTATKTASKAKNAPAELTAKYNPMRAAQMAETAPARPTASPRHVSTLKLLAAAYQAKRGEKV
jgi:hypothetical protein